MKTRLQLSASLAVLLSLTSLQGCFILDSSPDMTNQPPTPASTDSTAIAGSDSSAAPANTAAGAASSGSAASSPSPALSSSESPSSSAAPGPTPSPASMPAPPAPSAAPGASSATPTRKSEYADAMRSLIVKIADYGRSRRSGFQVLPGNAHMLLSSNGSNGGPVDSRYASAIDGVLQESLNYGVSGVDAGNSAGDQQWLDNRIDVARRAGKPVLVLDYVNSPDKVSQAFQRNRAKGFASSAAPSHLLDRLAATPDNVNSDDIRSLSDAKNFLYLLNTKDFSDREAFLSALRASPFDVIVVDIEFRGGHPSLTPSEVESLKRKPQGGKRLVLAYMCVGEASTYRTYWKPEWKTNPPSWMTEENPAWPGSFKVRFWEDGWQKLLMGSSDAHLDRLLAAGFDGTYLDVVDAYEYFANKASD